MRERTSDLPLKPDEALPASQDTGQADTTASDGLFLGLYDWERLWVYFIRADIIGGLGANAEALRPHRPAAISVDRS